MPSNIDIPGYLLEQRLGGGAMADVYLATQESLQRHVALKILKSELQHDLRERFIQEAHLIATISHPAIITIFDIGQSPSGNHYIAMEYLQGGELLTLTKHYDEQQSLQMLTKLAQALHEVHKHGIVHRDLKPSNILFRSHGEPVLCDFGVAKDLLDNTELTQAGIAVGTPAYMSPEQALGKPVDHRSDLYSLGIILMEMLVGENPYRSDSSTQTFINHVKMPVPSLPVYLKHWQNIVDNLLAKKLSARFKSAAELLNAIELYQQEHSNENASGEALPAPLLPQIKKQIIDSTTLLLSPLFNSPLKYRGLIAVSSLVLVLGLAFILWPSKQQTEIQRLLEQAELTLEQKLISKPSAHNATYYYQQVLMLDEDNAEAIKGIDDIVQHHIDYAKNALAQKNYKLAFQHIRQGIKLDPDNSDLAILKRNNAKNSNTFKRIFNKAKTQIIP